MGNMKRVKLYLVEVDTSVGVTTGRIACATFSFEGFFALLFSLVVLNIKTGLRLALHFTGPHDRAPFTQISCIIRRIHRLYMLLHRCAL